jgi:hypothetical protein
VVHARPQLSRDPLDGERTLTERKRSTIEVLNPDHSKSESHVEWWSDKSSCHVNLVFDGIRFCGTSTDFFAALAEARCQFEREGHRLLCYGASRNVWPSGMARDMGLGLKAYQLTIGQRGGVLREIFESGSDIVPATVEEQTSFFREWVQSLQ